ncbi:MAG: CPBP family intramembrane metalloprotease [Alcanivoracaceae bacterium]|nr:CPBP family intramembrane metalloprotease [Alcanivoracaceae bacterium]
MIAVREVFAGTSRQEWLFWGLSLAAMVAFVYPADERIYLQWFAAGDGHRAQLNGYLYHHAAVMVCFLLPLLLLKPLGIADYGLKLFAPGDWRWGLKWTLIACALLVLPTWVSSHDPQFQAEYPLAPLAMESPSLFLLFAGSYLLYYIGWEAFFRGFIGFGMLGLGYRPFLAMMVQVSLSCIIHIGKPQMELIGAIPGGILMGLLAYRSGSLLWPLLFHFYLGLLNTWFCWIN